MTAMPMLLIVLCIFGGGLVIVVGLTILAVVLINKDYPRDG